MRTFFTVFLLLFLTGSAPSLAQTPAEPGQINEYMRYQKTAPLQLDTAVVSMLGPSGQRLDLIAAVHLGDASYYTSLNQKFRTYDAVLYELILPEEVAGQRLPSKLETGSGISGIQGMMARSLGLTTQLENVDYSRENFVHADLTQEALSKTMDARQESLMSYLQKILLSSGGKNGGNLGVSEQEFAQLDLIAVITGTASAKDRKILKKVIASAMTQSDGLLTAMGDSAILSERNKAALKVLDSQVGKGRRNIALFYGAAHMPDLESRLTQKGWKRTGIEWVPAWSF